MYEEPIAIVLKENAKEGTRYKAQDASSKAKRLVFKLGAGYTCSLWLFLYICSA